MDSVGIVIVNFNGRDYLKDCLYSIKENTQNIDYKIVVVDNGSSDDSISFLKQNYPNISIIANKENTGFPVANNQGTKYLFNRFNPDYFYFLNNDTKVTPGWLTEVIRVSKKHNAALVTSKQIDYNGLPCKIAGWIKFTGAKYYMGNEDKQVGWVNGATLLVKKEIIERIGYLNENYSPAYYEETEWEKRITNAGYKIYYSPKSIVYHKGMGTSKKVFRTEEMNYYFYRNRIMFFLRYYPKIFFLPRFLLDVAKCIIQRKTKLLFKAYNDGMNILNNEK
jgi:GT2 family glycosyltransferase